MANEVGDETRAREVVDVGRLIHLLDATVVHHRDPVRQRERFGLIVRHINERDADFLLQVDQLDLHFLAELGIERRERLIEQQHRRMRHECARDGDALLLAARQFLRHSFREAGKANILERSVDLGSDLAVGCFGHA